MKLKLAVKNRDESGIISLLVVSILAITLSLVVIGFSKLADRELRQASERELSAQAYYAAESGLNDAIAYLTAGGTAFSGCSNWSTSPIDGNRYFTQDYSGNGVAKYSCIGIQDTPQVLSYTVYPGKPRIVKLSASGLQNLYFGWENAAYPASGPSWLGGTGSLPREDQVASSNPGATGVLRAGVYAVPAGDTSDTNANLATLSRTYFMYPNGGGGAPGPVNYGAGGYNGGSGPSGTNGSFVPGNCNTSRPNPVPSNNQAIPSYCNTVINGLNGTANTYYLYLTAQYAPLLVRLQGTTGGAGGAVTFKGAQGVIDVTGQGSGQLQRIRARVDLTNQYTTPSYALQSLETLCKDFGIQVIGQGQLGASVVKDPGDPACKSPTTGSGNIGSTAGDTGPHGGGALPSSQITLYEHIQSQSGGGQSWTFTSPYSCPDVRNCPSSANGIPDNFISSVKVQNGGVAALYDNFNFSGSCLSVTSNIPDFTTIGWNDVVSSFKVGSTC